MDGELHSNTPNAILSAALAYAELGWPVFPCAHDKRPLTTHGVKDATLDERKIRDWWTSHPDALVAVPTGAPSGFFVLDVDIPCPEHGDVDGLAAWEQMSANQVVPPTRQHRTANSGLHFLWKFDPSRPITNRRGDLPRGLDVRGTGGYVVMPPSRKRDGRAWTVSQMENIVDAPQFLYDIIGKPKSREELPLHDSDDSIRIPENYARKALEDEVQSVACAPRGQRNHRLNNAAFSLGQLVGADALQQAEVENRLHGAAIANGLVQDDGHAAVRATIASGLSAGIALPRRMPEKGFSGESVKPGVRMIDETEEPNAPVEPLLIWHGDVPPEPPPELVQGLLPQTGLAVIAGQSGFAKTFGAIDLALSAMTGRHFAGCEVVRTGGVLWLAAEGEPEVMARLEGAKTGKLEPEHHGDHFPFARQFLGVPGLREKDALASLLKLARATEEGLKALGVPLVLIIIDTLAAAANFDDENSVGETQKVANTLRSLSRQTGALVVVVDHYGKVVETGIRGSSAKLAAADSVLAFLGKKDEEGNVTDRRMAAVKVRWASAGLVVPFVLRSVPLDGIGFNTTCIVDWQAPRAPEQPKAGKQAWPTSLKMFKRALEAALIDSGRKMKPFADGPEVLAVDREKVREEFFKAYPADNLRTKAEAFRRCEREAVHREIMGARVVGSEDLTVFWTVKEEAHKP